MRFCGYDINNTGYFMDKNYTVAIILAGGVGTRMGSVVPKQELMLLGESIISRSVRAFDDCPDIDGIIAVVRRDEVERLDMLRDYKKFMGFVTGGETRSESASNGFLAAEERGAGYVVFHDAARPMITPRDISRVVGAAKEHGAASAARRVTETVKHISDGMITSTVNRDELLIAETPQAFSAGLYRRAIDFSNESYTDDNMYMEKIGVPVFPVITESVNIKITSPDDMRYAEYLLMSDAYNGDKKDMEYRIGHGYDVHRLVENRRLVLGGVDIPHKLGLAGHSDADVLVHAVMDAILGALGEGDIGRHFPDNDERYAGISSLVLLSRVREIVGRHNAKIVNIDATVVMQAPKIAGYIPTMRKNIADTLSVDSARINVKATTEEHLGFTGREEGIAAHAVAMISL